MIWIIGEYAERIDNADELLESFLEGFADENTQVQLQVIVVLRSFVRIMHCCKFPNPPFVPRVLFS